jgi:hypothetical protein
MMSHIELIISILVVVLILFVIIDQYRIRRNTGHQSNKIMKSTIKLIRHWIVNNLDLLVIIVGGIILSVRVFFPPKYYLIAGTRVPYDGATAIDGKTTLLQDQGNLLAEIGASPSIDYKTTLLQAFGIAVVTGVIFYSVRKLNKKKVDSQMEVLVVSENDQELDKSISDINNKEIQVKPYQANTTDICSLTAKLCEYYDVKENYCFYGKEGTESWKSKRCPKVENV